MEYIAVQKYARSTPKKLRIVRAMITELKPVEAVEMLPYSGKRAAEPLTKVIRSAMANAREQGANEEALRFKEIQINEGPRLKRGRPVSKGRWHPVLKRWSHVRVVLTDEAKVDGKKSTKKVTKKAKKETKVRKDPTTSKKRRTTKGRGKK